MYTQRRTQMNVREFCLNSLCGVESNYKRAQSHLDILYFKFLTSLWIIAIPTIFFHWLTTLFDQHFDFPHSSTRLNLKRDALFRTVLLLLCVSWPRKARLPTILRSRWFECNLRGRRLSPRERIRSASCIRVETEWNQWKPKRCFKGCTFYWNSFIIIITIIIILVVFFVTQSSSSSSLSSL